jgi:Domain of unknown function (DUF4326)
MPKRIQRRGVKGWRMPEGAVYVGRGSKWGNPYRVDVSLAVDKRGDLRCRDGCYWLMSPKEAVFAYRHVHLPFYTNPRRRVGALDLTELRGKDLACWCALDQPCHADVLLELANR